MPRSPAAAAASEGTTSAPTPPSTTATRRTRSQASRNPSVSEPVPPASSDASPGASAGATTRESRQRKRKSPPGDSSASASSRSSVQASTSSKSASKGQKGATTEAGGSNEETAAGAKRRKTTPNPAEIIDLINDDLSSHWSDYSSEAEDEPVDDVVSASGSQLPQLLGDPADRPDNLPENEKDLSLRPPYEYYCMPRPFFDVELQGQEEDDSFDAEEAWEQYEEQESRSDVPGINPVADWPDHKWFCMWHTWRTFANMQRFASYRCPDNFKMYIYNDWYGLGLQEVIDNQFVEFNKATRKSGDEKINDMWANMAGLVHWLRREELMPYYMTDATEEHDRTAALLGAAILATLNELELAGLLTADSRIRDLSLVMALALECMADGLDLGYDNEHFYAWRHAIKSYADKAGLDLANAPPYGTSLVLQKLDREAQEASARRPQDRKSKAIAEFVRKASGPAGEDLWKWKGKFHNYKKSAGDCYNILRMMSVDRKRYAFDGKDPLETFAEKDLREGNIMLE